MDLSKAPSEVIWTILENVKDLPTRKSLSLVSSSFNHMVFSTRKAQENLTIRICGPERGYDKTQSMFEDLLEVINASEPVQNFARFILTKCQSSIQCIKFINCYGLYRTVLLELLHIPENLNELHIHSLVINDGKFEVFPLTRLTQVSLKMSHYSVFFNDLCLLAPNLEDLQIETRHEFNDKQCQATGAIRHFSRQLKRLSFTSNRIEANEDFMFINCEQLVELKIKTYGTIITRIFEDSKHLRSLSLEGKITDDVLSDIGRIPTLENLSLLCKGFHVSRQCSQIAHLKNLKSLHLQGIYNFSWNGITLPNLKHLHLGSLGDNWMEFIERTQLESFEVHDKTVSNFSLQIICLSLPNLKRLELTDSIRVTDSGLQRLSHLTHLEELRLWGVQISHSAFREWEHFLSLKKLLIYASKAIDDDALAEIGSKLVNLRQVVIYDCHRITMNAVEELKLQLTECEVLQIFRGGVLPPSLKRETQIYNRTPEHPEGVLRMELPFLW